MKNTLIEETKTTARTASDVTKTQDTFEESSRFLGAMLFEAEQLEQLRREEERRMREAELQRIEAERIRLDRQFAND